MVRISITPEAFEAIEGERRIWIEAAVADRLTAMRRRGESYSDVILRLAEIEARGGML